MNRRAPTRRKPTKTVIETFTSKATTLGDHQADGGCTLAVIDRAHGEKQKKPAMRGTCIDTISYQNLRLRSSMLLRVIAVVIQLRFNKFTASNRYSAYAKVIAANCFGCMIYRARPSG